MVDGVEVKLGADTAAAKSGIADASSSIQGSLGKIKTSLEQVTTTSKTTADAVVRHNTDSISSYARLHQSISGGFTGSINVIERFKGVLSGLALVLAGGFLWKESIAAMLNFEEQVRKLEIVFGMLSDKATTTAIALKVMGKTGDDFAAMGMKLARQIKMDEQGLVNLGVVTRDASGALLPLDQIMQNAFATMQTYRTGVDQDEFALKAFGRAVGDAVDVMIKMPAAQTRAIQLQKELGIEMGPERQKQIQAYRFEIGAFNVAMGAIGEKIGAAVLPQLMSLAKWFNEYGPTAIDVILIAVKGIITALQVLGTVVGTVVVMAVSYFTNMVTSATANWQAIKAAATFNFGAIPGIIAAANAKIAANNKTTTESIVTMWAEAKAKISGLWEEHKTPEAPGTGPLKSGPKGFPTNLGAGAATAPDMMGQWRHELDQMRDAEDAFHELSKAAEAAFWESKLELAKKGGDKLYNEVYHLMVEAKKGAARQEFADQMASYAEQLVAAKNNRDVQMALVAQRTEYVKAKFGEESKEFKHALAEELTARNAWAAKDMQVVAIQTKMLEARADFEAKIEMMTGQQRLALRQINNAQLIALEGQLEDRTYAIKRAGLAKKMELEKAGPNDPVKVAEIDAQLEELEQKHQEKITQIVNAAELERKQFALAADAAVENSFATLIGDLVSGTKSWKQAMNDAIKSISSELSKLAAQAFAKQIFGGSSIGGGWIGSLMSSIFGGGMGGGAGFFGSMFGMPGFATGTSFVPRDTLAVVHRGEAIIPAQYNHGMGGGQALSVTNNFTISGPIDSRTQDQIAAAAARGVQRAQRIL